MRRNNILPSNKKSIMDKHIIAMRKKIKMGQNNFSNKSLLYGVPQDMVLASPYILQKEQSETHTMN
jgi:hypothetical protein